jgi:hypothetical protein
MSDLTADRSGTSPIGTSSPNSGASANTNTTYGIGAFTTGIEAVSGTSATLQNSNYDGIVSFTASGAIAVTLNSSVGNNFKCAIANLGSGTITLTPTLGYMVNGASSVTFPTGIGCTVYFANRQWTAFAQATTNPVTPQTLTPVAGEYLTGYNAITGLFSVSGTGLSVTITTAKLTTGGSNGTMTFVGGLLVGESQAT